MKLLLPIIAATFVGFGIHEISDKYPSTEYLPKLVSKWKAEVPTNPTQPTPKYWAKVHTTAELHQYSALELAERIVSLTMAEEAFFNAGLGTGIFPQTRIKEVLEQEYRKTVRVQYESFRRVIVGKLLKKDEAVLEVLAALYERGFSYSYKEFIVHTTANGNTKLIELDSWYTSLVVETAIKHYEAAKKEAFANITATPL